VAAPVLILSYGLIRLTDPDPDHGPGAVWTAGHLALAAAMLLFTVVLAGLLALVRPDAGRAGRLSAGAPPTRGRPP
jgi:hypothetical protein